MRRRRQCSAMRCTDNLPAMTAPLYRVTAGPHAGFVGRVDALYGLGLMVLAAGTERVVAPRFECELLPPAAQLHTAFTSLAEAGAALLMITTVARAMRASAQSSPGEHP